MITNKYIILGNICRQNGIFNQAIIVENKIIKKIINEEDFYKKDFRNIPIFKLKKNEYLAPSFIDVHIHGTKGFDVMDGNLESLEGISQELYKQGIKNFLATTMTESNFKIEQALKNVVNYKKINKNNNILGIHLEGPFISEEKIGAQNSLFLQKIDINLFKSWQKISNNNIRKVTIAPELENSRNFIKYLKSQNISISLGHTNCSAKKAQDSFKSGIDSVTHFFNAMSGLSHRNSGAVAPILMNKNLYLELIADGVHVEPFMLNFVYQMTDKIMLITDAISAQNVGDGIFTLGSQKVIVKNNEARLENGLLAGSLLTMNKALLNMIKFTDCNIVDALKMSSLNQAKNLKVDKFTGSIDINKKDDFIILNENYELKAVL